MYLNLLMGRFSEAAVHNVDKATCDTRLCDCRNITSQYSFRERLWGAFLSDAVSASPFLRTC